jgi:hypothetical protein
MNGDDVQDAVVVHDEATDQPHNGELPKEAAHRLIGRIVQPSVSHISLDRAFQLLFTRLRQPYASALSAADQAAMLDWMEAQIATTRQLMNGVAERTPFDWPAE